MQEILSSMRRAIDDYSMIQENDRIAVGVSGGKDSMLLLAALNQYKKFSKVKFDIIAVNIKLNFEDIDKKGYLELENYCKSNDIKLIIQETEIKEIVFDIRNEKNPCSLCSKMRRGALNTEAIKNNCNKIALGHNADDIIETFFLSLFYEARMSTFSPIGYMDRTKITLIRPFIYIDEKTISNAVNRLKLPTIKNPCPMDEGSKRQDIKDFVEFLNEKYDNSKTKILAAIFHPERNNLWDKYK